VLQRILRVGPTARLELERDDSGEIIEAELSATRVRSLNLRQGETLLVRPKGVQVFLGEKPASAVAESAAAPPVLPSRAPPAGWPPSAG
jgi:hypothetical protein